MYEEVRILITDEMRMQRTVYEEVRIHWRNCTWQDEPMHPPFSRFPLSSRLLSSSLLFSSLLHPLFVFLFLNSLFRKNLYTQRCTQHMNIPRRYSQQCFCKGIILNFFYNKNVAKQRGPPPPEDAEKSRPSIDTIDRKVHIKVGIVDVGRCIKSGDHILFRKVR